MGVLPIMHCVLANNGSAADTLHPRGDHPGCHKLHFAILAFKMPTARRGSGRIGQAATGRSCTPCVPATARGDDPSHDSCRDIEVKRVEQ